MKLDILLQEDNLEESKLRKVIAAAALAATTSTISHMSDVDSKMHNHAKAIAQKVEKNSKELVKTLKNIHPHIAEKDAAAHVELAEKYADPVFPKREDILAIIGIESTHKNGLVSHAGAMGLMQVDPKAWELDPNKLKVDKDYNVKNGAALLKKLHDKYKNKETAIKAYNIGIGSIARGIRQGAGERYFTKYKTELSKLLA